jgi:UDP-N-acetylglucosamine transferase subunit ALG13
VVFVTVGNATQGFRRLLDAVESLARKGAFGAERVLVQSGHTADFRPERCESVPFLGADDFDRALADAELIVSHGGTTMMTIARLGKVPVAMPRRHKYGEHVNDHQVQLVEALAAEGLVIPASEAGDLEAALERARAARGRPVRIPRSPMLALVGQAIDELTTGRGGR